MSREPTATMKAQMKGHLRYLQVCLGWTGDECRELVADYHEVMKTDEGFATVEAHLASVTPIEQASLARHEREAA